MTMPAAAPAMPAMPAPSAHPAVRALITILPAVAGIAVAVVLFLLLAALQPAALADDPARLNAVWAQVTTVELPPPEIERTRPEPAPLTAPTPRPLPRTPPPPRPRQTPPAPRLQVRPQAPPIDPLLQGISLSPDSVGDLALATDPNATALGARTAGGDDWLGAVDSRTLDALARLWGGAGSHRTATEPNRKPQWLQRIDPEYPPEALRKNLEGQVALRLRIDVSGRVLDAEVLDALSGYGFAQAAVAAARKSSFIPGTDGDGRPVEQWVKVVYRFELK